MCIRDRSCPAGGGSVQPAPGPDAPPAPGGWHRRPARGCPGPRRPPARRSRRGCRLEEVLE
eukprot:629021-Alexandrium_andersonii.AAC.1